MTIDELISLRKNAKLSQAEMAAGIGLRLRAYSDLEAAKVALQERHARAAERFLLALAVARQDPMLAPRNVRQDAIALARMLGFGAGSMPNVYIEARPKGRPEGTKIEDFVVEDHADHVLHTAATQKEAIDWAKQNNHHPLVARVRHLNDKKNPDHWRSA
jgi:transcriptional regulator with XRE-family HTH domain